MISNLKKHRLEIFRAEELKEPEWNPLLHAEPGQQLFFLTRGISRHGKTDPSLREAMEISWASSHKRKPICSVRAHSHTKRNRPDAGAINLVRTELAPLLDQAPQMMKELAPLTGQKPLRRSRIYKQWLQNDLLPRRWRLRLGDEKYRKKLRFACADCADGRKS